MIIVREIASVKLAKLALRKAIAAPGIRHALRWTLQQALLPRSWRDITHRKVAKRAHFGASCFDYTTHDGTRLRIAHVGVGNYLYWLNEYEPETTTVFCTLAREAGVILDIGAAQGIYSLFAAAANPSARILAFEPAAVAAEQCATNLELNASLARHIELQVLALGEHDEETTLYVAGETGGTSSLDPQFRENHRKQSVIVRSGDTLLAELGIERVDLIKIDTETTEPSVLRGLLDSLRRDAPDILCEVLHGSTERALESVLRPLGYQFFWITRSGLVPHDTLQGDPTYRCPNYLFTKRTRADLGRLGVRVVS